MTEVLKRGRRPVTAREGAARLGVSVSTVRRLMSEERGVYEARAQERRARIVELHREGQTGVTIARELGISEGLVSIRIREARELGELADRGTI